MAFIKAGKFRRYNGKFLSGLLYPKTLILNTRDLFRLPLSVLSSYKVLKKFKPDLVFSKGSFVAVPVGLAAKLAGVPIITHDSDSSPGLANRIIGRWAKIHATGLPSEFYSYKKSKIVQVGIPMNPKIQKSSPKLQSEAKGQLKLPKESSVLLVTGGGNGSKKLNELMIEIAPELLKTNLSLHIIHLTGPKHEPSVKAAYRALPSAERDRVSVLGFSSDFPIFLLASSLVITRAGATTLAEIAATGKACIVIPAPFLSGGHQLKNAQLLSQKDAVVVMPNETSPDELLAVVSNLLSDDRRRSELSENLNKTAITDASARLAKLILRSARKD